MKKTAWFVLISFVFILLAGCVVYRNPSIPPPPSKKKVLIIKPGPDHIWISGYWKWAAGRYFWVKGVWIKARRGKVWVPGRWVKRGRIWIWIRGRWVKVKKDNISFRNHLFLS
jgi:hypothetical protein